MSYFTCPHCNEIIDIFSRGGAERTAQQFNIPFLGSIELIPAIREGGDRGLPVTLRRPQEPASHSLLRRGRAKADGARRSRCGIERRRHRNFLSEP